MLKIVPYDFFEQGFSPNPLALNILKNEPARFWFIFKNMAEKEGFEPSIEL
jgi:hypothetical protein